MGRFYNCVKEKILDYFNRDVQIELKEECVKYLNNTRETLEEIGVKGKVGLNSLIAKISMYAGKQVVEVDGYNDDVNTWFI